MPKGTYERKKPEYDAMKQEVRELYEEGLTPKNIARRTGIPSSTVKGWVVALPKHSTGFSRRRHGNAAARVARLTGREGEAIRQEMEAKRDDPCFFCGSDDYDEKGWFIKAFHHNDDGTVERAHNVCNMVRRHAARS